ncbi:MAG: hypothetical protein ACUVTB_06950 [Candidatus Bathycorpusculaceae bacterium]
MRRKWVRERCISCSLCIVLCSFEVFKQANGTIELDSAKCVDCEECLPSIGCPRRAISI